MAISGRTTAPIRHSTPETTAKENSEKEKAGKAKSKKAKEITPLDLEVPEKKGGALVLVPTNVPYNNDTISMAIKNEADMKAKRDKEEARKVVEEEMRLREEAEDREVEKLLNNQKEEEKREERKRKKSEESKSPET